jgi:hypothetical protein
VRLRRPTRLPDDVRTALPLADGERIIAAAEVRGGGWVAATERALVQAGRRTPWSDVAHAQWYDEELLLALDPVPGLGDPVRLRLADPGRLPETVHERVMASIVLTRRLSLPGGGARVVARRGDGDDLVWQVLPDGDADLADPAVRALVDQALARLSRELG